MGTDVDRYWESRLAEHDGLRGVGWLGLGEAFNRWMYRVRASVFRRAVRDATHGDLGSLRVLDVGSGTGFYVDLWAGLGVASVAGSDLTQVSVERLRSRRPDHEFSRLDITADGPRVPGAPFDAVSVMDVLFHVVDDDAYARALVNLSALLAPGGLLVLSENLLADSRAEVGHQVSRTSGRIRALLAEAGLEPVAERPTFFLMNTPVDSSSRLLHAWWAAVSRVAGVHEVAGFALGAAVYPFELALTHSRLRGPSTKLMVCRRRG